MSGDRCERLSEASSGKEQSKTMTDTMMHDTRPQYGHSRAFALQCGHTRAFALATARQRATSTGAVQMASTGTGPDTDSCIDRHPAVADRLRSNRKRATVADRL
jgi:hypothetical protein